jgi:hypothetical protein
MPATLPARAKRYYLEFGVRPCCHCRGKGYGAIQEGLQACYKKKKIIPGNDDDHLDRHRAFLDEYYARKDSTAGTENAGQYL